MSSYAPTIYDRLTAHAALATALTGGIYLYTALPANGLLDVPAAFETGKQKIKPCLVVKGRALVPFSRIKEPKTGFQPARQGVEVWLYQDRGKGYDVISPAAAQVLRLLNLKPIAGGWKVMLANYLEEKAPELQNTNFIRLDFDVVGHTSN